MDVAGYVSFTISNSMGRQLLKGELTGTEAKVTLGQLPAGLYYLQLRGRAGSVTKKFIKNIAGHLPPPFTGQMLPLTKPFQPFTKRLQLLLK